MVSSGLFRPLEKLLVVVSFPLGSCAGCDCRWNRGPSLLEAGPAEYRTTLGGLKWNGGLHGAFRADSSCLRAYARAGSSGTLNFALLASLWIVLELLIVKEQLFAGGKNEVVTAI
jgi:hypothetical protein